MTTDHVGGVFSYCVDLARELRDRGVEVAVASMGPGPSPAQREQLREVLECEVPNEERGGHPGRGRAKRWFESQFALEWMDDPWSEVERAGAWLLEVQREFGPDIVHLNGYCHAALDWSVPTLVVAHSCVLSWWRAVCGEPAPPRYDEYAHRVERGLRAADCVVAPSSAYLEVLRGTYAFDTASRVIANGADAALFRPTQKLPTFFAAGRLWDRAKNLQLIERCASRLGWPVLVAGATHGDAQNAPSCLQFQGQLSRLELAQALAQAAVFVHPARYEPFGLSVLEAALSGCALVLGDIATLRELWRDAALYVNPDDEEGFVRACQRLRDDPRLRSTLAQRAQQTARGYSLSAMAEAYAELYAALASQSPAKRRALGERADFESEHTLEPGLGSPQLQRRGPLLGAPGANTRWD